jgi:hypothetical protein
VLAATILTAASGCDKTTPAAAATVDALAAAPVTAIDPAAPPRILFQLFGERGDPRLRPLAALVDGAVRPLALSPAGWRTFDSLYHRAGAAYTVYQDGRATGSARVTRAMWRGADAPLYTLPGCTNPTPLAAARVTAPRPTGYLVEQLASDADLTTQRQRSPQHASEALIAARAVGRQVAEAAGIEATALGALDFRARTVPTGADAPTLVMSFIDPAATMRGATGHATYLFILADRIDGRYVPTYSRLVRGSGRTSQYRRYLDHLDLTGDGTDELVLEGWASGEESYMLVLQFRQGRWTEIFRGKPSWCNGAADER